MKEIPENMFCVYALSLPCGLDFDDSPPIAYWRSKDGSTCAALTKNINGSVYGCLVLRRRVDDVWALLMRKTSIGSRQEAMDVIRPHLEGQPPREPLPPGEPRRPSLGDIDGKSPSKIFASLALPSRHASAWILNQLYLAFPNPDRNWASDCQTDNFHTRLWEAYLLACFREQGLCVTQDYGSPDFCVSRKHGGEVWIEAVTTNPETPYDHYGSEPVAPPKDLRERMIGSAAVRYAKTIRSKLQKNYHALPHVQGKPFAIAVADFHAPSSMMWSREARPSYLYGFIAKVIENGDERVAVAEDVHVLLGEKGIPAGLFLSPDHCEISAVIFSSGCTIAKLGRVAVSAGASGNGYRHIRVGEFYERTPGALVGIPFLMDVTTTEYRDLWHPYNYEPWSAELEVFHNPYARHPMPDNVLPEAAHWRMVNGEVVCSAFFPFSILWSRTLVLPLDVPTPTLDDLMKARDSASDT